MEWTSLIQIILGVVGLLLTIFIFFSGLLVSYIKRLVDSIDKLNVNMAILFEKYKHHDKVIKEHSQEIKKLQQCRFGKVVL